jgi:hypothetical protein
MGILGFARWRVSGILGVSSSCWSQPTERASECAV